MNYSAFDLGRMRRAVFSAANLPAAIALLVVAFLGVLADYQNRVLAEQAVRADVLAKVNLVRAKLEGNINGDLQLVRGLVATLSTEPNMTQARFEELAHSIFREESHLRNIAGAPGMVVTLMYPMKGNERAIGLDYRVDDGQREASMRARSIGRLVLAGPVELKQGGTGFIGRFPVFIDADGPNRRFWGIISAVVDTDRLYRQSGMFDDRLGLEMALTGLDGLGSGGEQFFGRKDMHTLGPVTADIMLPSGSWQLAAIPRGGWNLAPANTWPLRLVIVAACLLLVLPIMVAGRLYEERQRNYRKLHRSEREANQLSHRLELALDASQIGVWEHDLSTNGLIWDDRVNAIYGKPVDGSMRGFDDWAGTIHPDDLEGAIRDFNDSVVQQRPYRSEYRLMLPDGSVRTVRARGIFYNEPNETPKMIGAEWDVTADVALNDALKRAKTLAETRNAELEAAKARIEHVALHDSLTGLPNRRYLDEMLEVHAKASSQTGGHAALLHIDLDRFKQINDTLGHAAGDAMLIHASEVLKASVRAEDFVARIGGDEFVVLCPIDGNSTAKLTDLAERIIQEMRKPVPYQGHQCRFGVSIGIAVEGGGKDVDPKRLLIHADIALYRAKSLGRNRHEFFTRALQAEIVRTKRIADDILVGLERSEFIAHYQPQFDARTLDITGIEALARWQHPTEGLLSPDMFIKTAEELSVMETIDRIILEQTLASLDDWNRAGLHIPHVSVNVSAKRLRDKELVASLRDLDIKPGTLSFELLESIFLDDNDEAVTWNVDRIKDLKIDIEIDDFGTGYASIVSLLKLQPRRLKIDRQLVMPIVKSSKQRKLVGSIIEIGKSLGIDVLAEGVETMEHARILRDIGCDQLQGYAFARPMSAAAIKEFVLARSWRAAS